MSSLSRRRRSRMVQIPRHPGRTPTQRRVLDEIGRGDLSAPMTARTRDALLARGLIVQVPDKLVASTHDAALWVPRFEMPDAVYRAWHAAIGNDMTDDATIEESSGSSEVW